MHKPIDQNEDIYIYMRSSEKVYGALSPHLFHEKDSSLLFFHMAMFDDEDNLGLPPFFDIVFVSKSNEEAILKVYEDCHILDYERVMRCGRINILQEVVVYFKKYVLLGTNGDIE